MKRLFLLDGMALIYRAHFAFIQNPIRNSKGVNTSALYGFINTLLSILEKENPTHLGVAFDTSAPTPRHIRYPAYKAQRDEMPDELAAAIPHVKALCRAFALPVLEIDGFEADDLIGTLVKRAEKDGFESYMVTPDKDFAQLLSDKTFMWRPGRKGTGFDGGCVRQYSWCPRDRAENRAETYFGFRYHRKSSKKHRSIERQAEGKHRGERGYGDAF